MHALVTGASSGIGREIARLLAKRGYDLILVSRREERLRQLKEEIETSCGVAVEVKPCDLSRIGNVRKLFEECSGYDIEVLINNAGFGKIGFFEDIEEEHELEMIATNVAAPYLLTKLFLDKMKRGYIMNVSSLAAFQPNPKMAVYGASKAFINSFSKAVGYELKRQKKPIYICTLCPGPVDTEFNDVAKGHFNVKAMSPGRCARIAVDGMFRKKRMVIPGFLMKLVYFASKLAPDAMRLPISYCIQDKKTRQQ
jgi:short-subunit dehydrogenase